MVQTAELVTGDRMTRDEFIAVWDMLPDLKHAELIEGVVWVASPVSDEHSNAHDLILGLLFTYAAKTPDCRSGPPSSWLMESDMPEPDAHLRRTKRGSSRKGKRFKEGVPELIVEICTTSRDYDFGSKLRLYQRAGVQEYVTVETFIATQRIIWRVLEEGRYKPLEMDDDRIFRSREFPGLWLDVDAFWADDVRKMLDTLDRGIKQRDSLTA